MLEEGALMVKCEVWLQLLLEPVHNELLMIHSKLDLTGTLDHLLWCAKRTNNAPNDPWLVCDQPLYKVQFPGILSIVQLQTNQAQAIITAIGF